MRVLGTGGSTPSVAFAGAGRGTGGSTPGNGAGGTAATFAAMSAIRSNGLS